MGHQQIDVGLKRDQILQRFLARHIFREAEFLVVETDGTEHCGFITGFDERCIQMSTTPEHAAAEPHSILVFWPVRRIEATGNRVTDLGADDRSKIRSYGHALRSQCEQELNRIRTNGNGQRRDTQNDAPLFPTVEFSTEL